MAKFTVEVYDLEGEVTGTRQVSLTNAQITEILNAAAYVATVNQDPDGDVRDSEQMVWDLARTLASNGVMELEDLDDED